MEPTPCRACSGQWPRGDHRITESELTVAYLYDDQFFPGWTVLVLKRHATELFELSPGERSRLIEEVSTMTQALFEAFHPIKMNYELLGNQLPHIHWHLIPRLPVDPAPKEPVWTVPHEPTRLTDAQLRERIDRIQAWLQSRQS